MKHHPSDRILEVGGEPFILRFSLRSLALISLRLGADGPQALAAIMSEPSLIVKIEKARTLLSCFLLRGDMPELSRTELVSAMSLMADMIEEAFRDE